MRSSVISQLMVKDYHLQRTTLLLSVALGAVAIAVAHIGGEVPLVIGTVWLFVALIVLGCMLPISAIVNERKKQNLPFILSLPVNNIQYTTAKLLSSLLLFIVPWLALVGSVLLLIYGGHVLPQGVIPMLLILSLLPVIGFCLISGCALVGESEGWSMAATLVCNSSYGITWYLLARMPAFNSTWKSPLPVWNAVALRALSIEFVAIVLILGITLFLQWRKRDFI
jgi:ABC-2 type transport system permease protein